MRVFVLAIFLMFMFSACGSKSRAHRKIPLKTLEADMSIEVDSAHMHSHEGVPSEN